MRKHFFSFFIPILFFSYCVFASDDIEQAAKETNRDFGHELLKTEQIMPVSTPMDISEPESTARKPQIQFRVSRIELIGCKSCMPSDFSSITDRFKNRQITLADLENLAKMIKNEYIRKGILAAVIVPPQEIRDSAVIHIIEARMGLLNYNEHPFFKFSRPGYYWQIEQNAVINYSDLKKSLHLVNKNPDRKAKATLHSGKAPGTTDITLDIKTDFPMHIATGYDNLGTPATGTDKYNISLRHNNFLGLDDSFLTGRSFGDDFNGIYFFHTIPLNNKGTSFMYSYSYSRSFPKKQYRDLLIDSRAKNTGLYLRQDLFNQKGCTGEMYFGLDLKDKSTHTVNGTNSRDRLRIIRAGVNRIIKNTASVLYLNPELSQGINGPGAVRQNNLSSGNTKNTFTKLNTTLQYKKRLSAALKTSLNLSAQLSSRRLAPQEQLSLGGPNSVRGYPSGDFLADYGGAANFELYLPMFLLPGKIKLPGQKDPLASQSDLFIFYDFAKGYKKGNMAAEDISAELSSVGIGLNIKLWNFLVRMAWGFPLGDRTRTESADSKFHLSVNFES